MRKDNERPKCKVTFKNEPNLDLMTKAMIWLTQYEEDRKTGA